MAFYGAYASPRPASDYPVGCMDLLAVVLALALALPLASPTPSLRLPLLLPLTRIQGDVWTTYEYIIQLLETEA